jgi:two-component system NtrC family response regulator/two-component system response regulator AtoC
MRLLAVDDETVALASVRRLLKRRGISRVETCGNGREAIERIKKHAYDVVLLDLLMPEIDGLQVLKEVRPFCPRTEFVMLTAVDDVATAVKALQLGAYDYLVKPVENERLVFTIERAFERKGLIAGLAGGPHVETRVPEAFSAITTQCRKMLKILSYANVMAQSDISILLAGETGTGKELMARGIHGASPAAAGPFIPVNVASIPASLFESQFFGHVKGAFTGAENEQAGFFERADGGTLFLDEIGELPPGLQVKLLRCLEDGAVTRVGGAEPVPFKVRIVSATNRDLEEACRSGQFRLDLFYRINSVSINLPPLREREGDVHLLAEMFLKASCPQNGKKIHGFTSEAMQILVQKSFPGNIRELKQIVERAVLLADTNYITPVHLGETRMSASLSTRTLCSIQEDIDHHVAFVLRQTGGDRKKAAEILGVSIRQVQRKIAGMRDSGKWADFSGDT